VMTGMDSDDRGGQCRQAWTVTTGMDSDGQ
jgi:hypothetical protein